MSKLMFCFWKAAFPHPRIRVDPSKSAVRILTERKFWQAKVFQWSWQSQDNLSLPLPFPFYNR
jgi:hypothetical protein